MNELNNKPGITYRVQIKDHTLRLDEGMTVEFKHTEDLYKHLVSGFQYVLYDYHLEQLVSGEISNITIILTPDDLEDEDFETFNAG